VLEIVDAYLLKKRIINKCMIGGGGKKQTASLLNKTL
jgi:hypothetical protein